MPDSTKKGEWPERSGGLSRRDLGRVAGLAALGGLVPSARPSEAAAPAAATTATPAVASTVATLSGAPDPKAAGVYEALGVRPLINCRGTITVIGGSAELPEVRAAKSLANQQFVQLDELMDAAGKRLAALTGAEWGMVSAGCAAGLSHATAACVAGGNPDLHVRIPNLTGFPKDEVIIPSHSRNVYDAAIRVVGVKVIEVETAEDLQLAIGPKTAMIYVFANDRNETGPMSLERIAEMAKPRGIPILVDAAAEILTIPNVHLQRGATMVGYSGGKIVRGPQSAGLLLGRKDLVQAAWVHSAPHHGYARGMKIGREEVVGMVVAVESWVKRNQDAEWAGWVARCDYIADRVSKKMPGITASVLREADGRDNRSPRVTLRWNSQKLGITGAEVADILFQTEPRIALGSSRGGAPGENNAQNAQSAEDTGISITAYMMADGDEKIVADRLLAVLGATRPPKASAAPQSPAGDLTGRWEVDIAYAASRGTHTWHLVQQGNHLQGTHQGNFLARDISGSLDGGELTLTSSVTERHGDSLRYGFRGTLAGDTIAGTLDMGEYLKATWTARRHTVNRP